MEFDGEFFFYAWSFMGLFLLSLSHIMSGVLELTMFFSCSLRGSSRYVVNGILEKEIDFPHFCSIVISPRGRRVLGCIQIPYLSEGKQEQEWEMVEHSLVLALKLFDSIRSRSIRSLAHVCSAPHSPSSLVAQQLKPLLKDFNQVWGGGLVTVQGREGQEQPFLTSAQPGPSSARESVQ